MLLYSRHSQQPAFQPHQQIGLSMTSRPNKCKWQRLFSPQSLSISSKNAWEARQSPDESRNYLPGATPAALCASSRYVYLTLQTVFMLCILHQASKFNVTHAIERLQTTIKWRFEYAPDKISADEVAPEANTGKSFLSGFDRLGRPVWYLAPAKENTKTFDRQLRFTAFNVEQAIKLMSEGVESILIVVDYQVKGFKT
jgi:hypothetical protein